MFSRIGMVALATSVGTLVHSMNVANADDKVRFPTNLLSQMTTLVNAKMYKPDQLEKKTLNVLVVGDHSDKITNSILKYTPATLSAITLPIPTDPQRVISSKIIKDHLSIQTTIPFSREWNDLQKEELRHIIRGKLPWGKDPERRGSWAQWFHSSRFVYKDSDFFDAPQLVLVHVDPSSRQFREPALPYDGKPTPSPTTTSGGANLKELEEILSLCNEKDVYLHVLEQPHIEPEEAQLITKQLKGRLVHRFINLEMDKKYKEGYNKGYSEGSGAAARSNQFWLQEETKQAYERGFQDGVNACRRNQVPPSSNSNS